jgi:hypothetical protein
MEPFAPFYEAHPLGLQPAHDEQAIRIATEIARLAAAGDPRVVPRSARTRARARRIPRPTVASDRLATDG